ncbi:hypothetical protein LXL04_022865 [Taraxacum kok-saghyz]
MYTLSNSYECDFTCYVCYLCRSSSLCVRGMNQDNWGMSENHGYNHYSNNSCDDEFYNNGCDYGDQYESHDNDWQWTDNSGQNQYQDSSFFLETQESPCFPQNQYHESHDNDWQWTDNPGQNQYQEPPFFSEYQYQNQHQETHDNNWQWTDNPGQNQYQESPSFEQQGSQYHDNDWQWTDNPSQNQYQEPPYVSENQDSLDESFSENLENQDEYSFDENANQMLDMMNISLEKCNQKFDELIELLNLQPSDNIADTTQLEEVSFIFYDEPFDDKEHEPTSPLVEVVMKDYVSLDYTDSESDFENNEVIINLETSNETFYDLETPENRSDTTHENDVSFPFSNNLLDTKLHEPTPPELELEVVVEDYVPLNDTIPENEEFKINVENNLYEQIIPNVLEGSIEADTDPDPTELKACEKQELRVLLFELTNDPPISDNTLESCLPCFRTKALECQVMEGRFLSKKYNATYAYKSKMKKFYGIKLQRKKFTQRRDVLFFKQRWKFSHKNLKGKRFGLNKVKGNTPFDPGGRPKIKTMGLEAPHYSATVDRCIREEKRAKVENPRKTLKSLGNQSVGHTLRDDLQVKAWGDYPSYLPYLSPQSYYPSFYQPPTGVALSNEDIAMSKLEVGTINSSQNRSKGCQDELLESRRIFTKQTLMNSPTSVLTLSKLMQSQLIALGTIGIGQVIHENNIQNLLSRGHDSCPYDSTRVRSCTAPFSKSCKFPLRTEAIVALRYIFTTFKVPLVLFTTGIVETILALILEVENMKEIW